MAPEINLTIDDVVARSDGVVGHLTQAAGGATEGRTILLRIDGGIVQEHWIWAAPFARPLV